MASCLKLELRSQIVHGFDTVWTLSFLMAIQMACDTNSVPKGTAAKLFSLFTKELA